MPQNKIRPSLMSLTFASVLATTISAWGLAGAGQKQSESSTQTRSSFDTAGMDRAEKGTPAPR